jgi:hypothetical protein
VRVLGRVSPDCSSPDYYDYREQARSMASVSAITAFTQRASVTGRGEPERIDVAIASYDLFRTLGVNPIAGRHFTEEEGRSGSPEAVIISHAYWQRKFGGAADAVGQTLTLNGRPVVIAGVMPAGFRFLSDVQAWQVMKPDGPYPGVRRFHNWVLVARLKPEATLAQARQEADVIFRRLEAQYPDSNKAKSLELSLYQDAFARISPASWSSSAPWPAHLRRGGPTARAGSARARDSPCGSPRARSSSAIDHRERGAGLPHGRSPARQVAQRRVAERVPTRPLRHPGPLARRSDARLRRRPVHLHRARLRRDACVAGRTRQPGPGPDESQQETGRPPAHSSPDARP